jgi:phosphatidylglycerol---prolipoprotein diacylglyceryl transferase
MACLPLPLGVRIKRLYEGQKSKGKALILPLLADATSAIRYDDLHMSPIALDLGFFKLRWYSLGYIAGILLGWWYLVKLLAQPGAPMAKRHADDFIFYATLGIILGGRLGYCLFYKPALFLNPIEIFKLWEGGMSLHGGFLGVIVALFLFTRKHQLNMLRVCDYVACVMPFGLFLVRLANFANGELWGRPTDVPWAVIFPGTGDNIPRHPSQLYEAVIEGLLMAAILWPMFWKTDARYQPGKLVGTGLILYGVSRFSLEFLREPDRGLENLSWGLTMGQTLSTPMIIAGIYLLITAKGRRQRVEPVGGARSVA